MLLAQALINDGKDEAAVEVLDKGIEFFPNNKFPFDYFMMPWADVYYDAGADEKATELVEVIFERYADDLAYYNSLSPRFMDAYQDNVREALAVLQRLGQITRENKKIDIANEIDSVFYEEVGRLNLR